MKKLNPLVNAIKIAGHSLKLKTADKDKMRAFESPYLRQ